MKTGCMLCGAPLQYFNQPRTLACAVCGERFQADAACEYGHYVCDACHAASAGEAVVRACLHASERNPAKIALRIMRHPAVHMHGPEHHALTGCVLLAAYHASGGAAELETGLPEIVRRAGRIPGGSCGFMGCCGAAVGAGTYWSVAAGATPLSRGAWAAAAPFSARRRKPAPPGDGAFSDRPHGADPPASSARSNISRAFSGIPASAFGRKHAPLSCGSARPPRACARPWNPPRARFSARRALPASLPCPGVPRAAPICARPAPACAAPSSVRTAQKKTAPAASGGCSALSRQCAPPLGLRYLCVRSQTSSVLSQEL